jgi:DNA-binding Lrp family transcriptional regulator
MWSLLKAKNYSREEETSFIGWCAQKENVLYCTKRVGNFDFEVNVAIKDKAELHRFLSEFRRAFSGMIDRYELIINSEKLKLNYFPL